MRDGEFLDAQLCSTSVASSNQLQQPDSEGDAAFQASERPQEEYDLCVNGPEGFGNDYDDGGGGDDDGYDYMHQESADQHDNAMPGGHPCLVVGNADLEKLWCQLNDCTLHFSG